MRKNIVIVSILVGSMLLGGCSRKGELVELYRGVSAEGYADTVKLSGVKRNNYSGYFLGEGISLETALELSNESLNNLCYGWNWELSGKKYNGEEIRLEEGESEELWGVEREVEKVEDLEDAVEEGSEEETKESEAESEGEAKEGTEGESEENKSEAEEGEVETEIVVETSGTVEKLVDIVDRELVLKSGQVLTVVPNYIAPVVEEEESSEDGNTEGTGSEQAEGSEEGEESAEKGTNETEEVKEEPEEIEPLPETLKAIVVTNYSKENRTIKSCVESGWFTLQVDNYTECFGMKPLESEEEIPTEEVFSRLSESFGNPSIIWEQPTDDANYVKGMVQMIYAYEFPEYTFLAGVVGDTINSMYYIPKSLWLESDEYVGMKSLYRGSYIEVDKLELPEVEEVE